MPGKIVRLTDFDLEKLLCEKIVHDSDIILVFKKKVNL